MSTPTPPNDGRPHEPGIHQQDGHTYGRDGHTGRTIYPGMEPQHASDAGTELPPDQQAEPKKQG